MALGTRCSAGGKDVPNAHEGSAAGRRKRVVVAVPRKALVPARAAPCPRPGPAAWPSPSSIASPCRFERRWQPAPSFTETSCTASGICFRWLHEKMSTSLPGFSLLNQLSKTLHILIPYSFKMLYSFLYLEMHMLFVRRKAASRSSHQRGFIHKLMSMSG